MSKLVTIFGGSGFVGRYVARRMAKAGWRVRVAVRLPNEAIFVKPYGVVGQVEPVFCNIRDDASVKWALRGADAVINCVGILQESGRNRFDAVQTHGAGRIARLAAEGGIAQMVHISAMGADLTSDSAYSRSKAAGEAEVLAHMPGAMIVRPSIVFGAEDQFFNRFASMARFGPILPIVGAETQFQPVFVDDVARAVVLGATGVAAGGIYELAGPERDSFRGLMQRMLDVIQRRRLIIGLPMFVARLMATGFTLANKLSFGLAPMPITRDQIHSLSVDNVPSGDCMGLADLQIEPTALESVLPDYLWPFRVSGQYADIKASAKNLKA
ncbi:complex I NDUFA9 subunit family protein [Planktomarina temperata]|nr:complex I NDUFA9 subunit family protein [Planktomarina temperata]